MGLVTSPSKFPTASRRRSQDTLASRKSRPIFLRSRRSKSSKVLGHSHWTVLSRTDLAPSLEALKRNAATASTPSQGKKPGSPLENNSSSSTGRSFGSASSIGSLSSDFRKAAHLLHRVMTQAPKKR